MIELLHAKGYNSKNLLIIGDGPETDNLIQTISECRGWGLTIIGRMGKEKERREKRERRTENEREVPILGSYGELRAVLHRYPVDEVIFNLTPEDVRELDELLTICREEGVAAHLVATSIPEGITPLRQETLHGIRLLPVTGFYRPVWQSAIKRGIDIVISAILLILLLPLFAVIALLIKLTSSGPIFYWWHVLGINKKPFIGYKFRTMIENADDLKPQLMDYNEMNGPAFKMRNDPRVTSFGRFLRKYSLDELPQLWSVLKGDMSLVGPHPPLQTEVEKFKDWHRRKLSVKPGITCFWQINGRHEIGDFDEWAGLDLQYIDNWSLWLDFKILLKTIPAVLKGTGV
jgi:exopolysaccharide biosynthesis polyprenyl glycosylphosphotransferase